jgi:glycosyltransferase involved in cell wall biosynthesis
VLPEFYRRVRDAAEAFGKPYEIVLVNDGSKDRTWELMQEYAAADPYVVAVNLSRNHGHQMALTAGLSTCRGQRIFILDADLQDPPELLGNMHELMEHERADVVYGVRRTRPFDTPFKRFACMVFYRILDRLTDHPIPLDSGDFRLITRRALNTLMSMPEQHRFLRGMISWIGYRQLPYAYDREGRFAGDTKYPFSKLLKLAKDGVTAFSVKPLTMAIYMGLITGVFAVALLIYAIVSWIIFESPQGWPSTMAAIAILGSVQLMVLGVIGEYLGRLYEQSKGRPLFIIDEIVQDGQALRVEPVAHHALAGPRRSTDADAPSDAVRAESSPAAAE